MLTLEGSAVWVYDIEVFSNYFLATFYNGEAIKRYEDPQELKPLLNAKNLILAGFNNLKYDDPILAAISKESSPSISKIYELSNVLINCESASDLFSLIYTNKPWRFSIDVFQLLNAKGSLKEWECKYGLEKVMESPCDFNQPLPTDKIPLIREYCLNDVLATYKILVSKWDLVTLRTTLKAMYDLCDLVYCMSEQGIAQHTFLTLHRHQTGETSRVVKEQAAINPNNNRSSFQLLKLISPKVKYDTEEFKSFFDTFSNGRVVKEDQTAWRLDVRGFSKETSLAGKIFAIGVGGIHTVDKPAYYSSNDDNFIVDLDVTSYYPSIIINENLYPAQLGPSFVDNMRLLRDQRIKAKISGDNTVANALKIVINSTFGKLNDAFSPLRSVPDAHRVTINGQLFILMLVEKLHCLGVEIISANTDGVTIFISKDKYAELKSVISLWEDATECALEEVRYSRYIRRDINNYIAISEKGKLKLKGCFEPEPPGAGKWDGIVIKKAAVNYFTKDIPVEHTVNSNNNLIDFLFYQRSKVGILCFDKQQIGKSARWYAAICGGKVCRYNANAKTKKDGTTNYYAQIPHGESSSLANDLSEFDGKIPEDLDRQYYIDEADKLIRSIKHDYNSTISTECQSCVQNS